MAETETRLETLEDEVKVLKGEVKRTLVDLRALLMREDSPLGEGAIAKRMAMQNPVPANEAPKPVEEPVSQPVVAAPAPEPQTPAPAVAPEPASVPVASAPVPGPGPGPGTGIPPQPVAAPGPPPTPGPGPGPGPGAFPAAVSNPVPPADSPPGPPPSDNSAALAQQERMMAEQERRMAEQDRKMAEQDRKMAQQDLDERGKRPVGAEDDELPKKKPRRPARSEDEEDDLPRSGLQNRSDEPVPVVIVDPDDEEGQEPPKPSPRKSPKAPWAKDGLERDEDEDDEAVYELEEDELDEVKPRPSKNGRSKLAEDHVDEEDEDGEDAGDEEGKSDSKGKSERVTSIYDEYRDLLEETRQSHPVEDSPVGPPLDINLLSNLVYWAALAKQRVGEEQLKDLLQLYIQSGHSRPELQDLLLHISKMVEADPLDVNETTSDWVDLMFHLHGILTGGFPVIKIPQIRLPIVQQTDDEDDDGY